MKLSFRRGALIAAIMCLCLPAAFAVRSVGDAVDTTPSLPLKVADYKAEDGWALVDRNGSGHVDYAVKVDKKGLTVAEAIDINDDGQMDDFYLYENGVLVRREVDSTFTGKIDLWVYMYQGVYIAAYERDTKHDGTLGVVKVFGAKAAANGAAGKNS